MKWIRATDGIVCFGFGVFLSVATFQDFFLDSVPITDIVKPAYRNLLAESTAPAQTLPGVCSGASGTDPTVSPTCVCLIAAGSSMEMATSCINMHNGLPGEQVMVGRINPNFILFYIFMLSAMYQLVLRNGMGIVLPGGEHRDVQIGVGSMCFVVVLACFVSVFQFDHGVNFFVLCTFMPQQIVLMLLSFVLYSNSHSTDVDTAFREKYVHAMFAGVFNISTIPMMAVFVCCVNSWTTVGMIYFMYNTTMLLTVVQLAYHCVYIDSYHVPEPSDTVKHNPTAMIRMRQALYLLLTSVLTCITVMSLVYMPMHNDGMHRFFGISFVICLWVLHILFDATKASSVDPYNYERSFNIFDGAVSTIRYLLLIFVFYLVWGYSLDDSV
jgi:hypothetical protein